MPDSQWLAVVEAVVPALDAALDCTVFDGPPNSGDSLQQFVCIGASPENSDGIADPNGGEFTQDYRTIGGDKDERGSVNCYIETWAGDTTFTGIRTDAFGILDDINATLRDDMTLDLTGVMAPEIELTNTRIRQGYTQSGVRVQIEFTLSYRTII